MRRTGMPLVAFLFLLVSGSCSGSEDGLREGAGDRAGDLSGIGERTQILIRSPDREAVGLDGTTQVPPGYDEARVPPGPEGVPLGAVEAQRLEAARDDLMRFEGSRRYFLYVLGASGGARITTAILNVLSRAMDEGLPFEDAMRAPRFHPDLRRAIEATEEAGGFTIQLEESETAAWPPAAFERLKALGFQVESGTAFGRVHGIHLDEETVRFVGVADRRGTGGAVGPKPENLEEVQR